MSDSADMPLDRLLVVAKNQRGIMLTILAHLAVFVAGLALALPALAVSLASLVVGLASLYFTVMLARAVYGALGTALSVVFLVGPIGGAIAVPEHAALLRLAALIALLVVNQRATKELKAAGFKVGLLGGDPADVERRMGR